MDWRHRAVCLDEDPELFFPIGNTGPAIMQIEEAKQVCRRCDVREQCLAWALSAGQDHGVWGGLSEDERLLLIARPNGDGRRKKLYRLISPPMEEPATTVLSRSLRVLKAPSTRGFTVSIRKRA